MGRGWAQELGTEGILGLQSMTAVGQSEPGRGTSGRILRQAVDACRVDELLVSDLLLQVTLQFLQVNLSQRRASHYKHSKYAVNALQREAL